MNRRNDARREPGVFPPAHGRGHAGRTSADPNPPVSAAQSWSTFWQQVQQTLRQRGYAESSIGVYRCVLRAFYRFSHGTPAQTTRESLRQFLYSLVQSGRSANWLALNISVLRTVFDKLCGLGVAGDLRTPKRGRDLPVVLSEQEARRLLESASCLRDQLLLSLLYGAGLKPSEALNLRWADIDLEDDMIHVTRDSRRVPLPPPLRNLLAEGKSICSPRHVLFAGRAPDTPLSRRSLERIVGSAAARAGLRKHVTAMTLRHSFAVRTLERGTNEAVLQTVLGHRHIETTMKYGAYQLDRRPISSAAATPLRQSLAALWNNMTAPPTTTPPPEPDPSARSLWARIQFFYSTLKTRFFRLHGLPLRC